MRRKSSLEEGRETTRDKSFRKEKKSVKQHREQRRVAAAGDKDGKMQGRREVWLLPGVAADAIGVNLTVNLYKRRQFHQGLIKRMMLRFIVHAH